MKKTNDFGKPEDAESSVPKCGIVMPISEIDGCSTEHWTEVQSIIRDCITAAKFEPNLVSYADESGIIQKRIIHNLYSNAMVVCDVSGKNPNVMFELGLRLAFDKPTIIVKDDKTDYSFDTQIIEHVGYPRDLRFNRIVAFKENLTKKLIATYEKATTDPNYTTFLKNFGEYKVAQLTEKVVSSEKYLFETLEDLKAEIGSLKRSLRTKTIIRNYGEPIATGSESEKIEWLLKAIKEYKNERNIKSDKFLKDDLEFESLYKHLLNSPELDRVYNDGSLLREHLDSFQRMSTV